MVFAGELDDESTAFEPLLGATHHAHDLAGVFSVEVRVGKGSGLTPPIWVRFRVLVSRIALVRHSRHVSMWVPDLVRINANMGNSCPQTLHTLVSIHDMFYQLLFRCEAVVFVIESEVRLVAQPHAFVVDNHGGDFNFYSLDFIDSPYRVAEIEFSLDFHVPLFW